MYRWLIRSYAALALQIGFTSNALALTDCSFTTIPNNFGAYDPMGNVDSTSGGVAITCTVISAPAPAGGVIAYTVSASAGNSGSYSARRMLNTSNPAHGMNYNLYVNGSRNAASIWGDTTGGTQIMGGTVTGLALGNPPGRQDHVIYGRIPGGQGYLAVGNYSDNLVITLTF